MSPASDQSRIPSEPLQAQRCHRLMKSTWLLWIVGLLGGAAAASERTVPNAPNLHPLSQAIGPGDIHFTIRDAAVVSAHQGRFNNPPDHPQARLHRTVALSFPHPLRQRAPLPRGFPPPLAPAMDRSIPPIGVHPARNPLVSNP